LLILQLQSFVSRVLFGLLQDLKLMYNLCTAHPDRGRTERGAGLRPEEAP